MDEHPFVYEVPGNNGGYPVLRNTGIPVRVIVEFYRKLGNFERLAELYPNLSREQLQGALDYYAAYPTRVDEDIERHAQAWAEHQNRVRSGHPWPA
jgi:uncharacterized protein (DUF433 family)